MVLCHDYFDSLDMASFYKRYYPWKVQSAKW